MNKKTGHIEYAYLETTNHCNLECSFCNRWEVIGPLKHMALPKWIEMLDKLKHHPLRIAKLMGMGEPFLHPQFDIVIEEFKNRFPDCYTIVATNCQYPLKPDSKLRSKFERALKSLDQLYLSIDGYKEHYERDRAPAKWDKLIDFLEDFKTIDRGGCDVVINYVVNAYNIDDIIKIDELRKHYKLGNLRLNIAQLWGAEDSIQNNIETSGYSLKQLNYLKENWKDNIMGKGKWDFDECFWVKEGLYVTVEGNVKICCMNTGAKPVGNIFSDTIENIHNSVDYQNIKNGCLTNNPTSHCKHCSYKELTPILSHLGVQNK